MKQKDIAALLDEPACAHNKKEKSDRLLVRMCANSPGKARVDKRSASTEGKLPPPSDQAAANNPPTLTE